MAAVDVSPGDTPGDQYLGRTLFAILALIFLIALIHDWPAISDWLKSDLPAQTPTDSVVVPAKEQSQPKHASTVTAERDTRYPGWWLLDVQMGN
jgi:hypothetical protein